MGVGLAREDLERRALRLERAGGQLEGLLHVAALEGLARLAAAGRVRGERPSEELSEERLCVGAHEREAEALRVPAVAEALEAEVIRGAAPGEEVERRARARLVLGARSAEPDREVVPAEMPDLELVLVPRGREDLDLRVLEALELLRPAELEREGLARDRARVLEARVAHVAVPDVERSGEPGDRVGCAQAALLDLHVEVLALARRLVEGHLLDDEVLRDEPRVARDRGHVLRAVGADELGGQRERAARERGRLLVDLVLLGHVGILAFPGGRPVA